MPASSPPGLRLLGKSVALLSLTALMAYGCEKAKEQQTSPPPAASTPKPTAPAAPAATPPEPKAAAPATPTPQPKDAPKPADTAKPTAADAPKPAAEGTDAAKPADKPKPIPHTDIAKDAKPLREFTTPTSVIVQEFKEGEAGAMPTLPKAIVTIHFVLRLKDGWKQVQSTYEDGAPETFAMDELVHGMADGIIGMKPGAIRRITVPPARGFGKEGAKDPEGKEVIPPDATLVYDIELVSNKQKIVDKPAAPAPTHTPIRTREEPKPDVNK